MCVCALGMRKCDRYAVVGYRFTVLAAQHISQLKHLKRSGFVFIKLCFGFFFPLLLVDSSFNLDVQLARVLQSKLLGKRVFEIRKQTETEN